MTCSRFRGHYAVGADGSVGLGDMVACDASDEEIALFNALDRSASYHLSEAGTLEFWDGTATVPVRYVRQ